MYWVGVSGLDAGTVLLGGCEGRLGFQLFIKRGVGERAEKYCPSALMKFFSVSAVLLQLREREGER